jgi:hypothetical protein
MRPINELAVIFETIAMKTNFEFFKTKMPESRKADFYLGCLDGSVFIDFNQSDKNLISLCRISFDSYGCCDIEKEVFVSRELSNQFLNEFGKKELDQTELTKIVKEIIKLNEKSIWRDALEEYNLIEK